MVRRKNPSLEMRGMPEKNLLRRAVFLDRDGTICEEMGYVNHIDRLRIFPYAADAIRRLNEAQIPVVVITNQSGIARGIFPESLVHQIHKKMIAELASGGAWIDAIYFCPHVKADDCECRKPKPGLLERAAREHGLDLADSWVIGDRYADVEMAHRSGGRGILVMTGYGRGEFELHRQEWPQQPDAVADNLTEAVRLIVCSAPGTRAVHE
jgi:D-glycero-D-manno-heptose 1,7-bisphosphate phosphatase